MGLKLHPSPYRKLGDRKDMIKSTVLFSHLVLIYENPINNFRKQYTCILWFVAFSWRLICLNFDIYIDFETDQLAFLLPIFE